MDLPPRSDTLDKVESLVAELKAIELWNVAYWNDAHPEQYETIAYLARRERRVEVLAHLTNLIPRLQEQDLWIVKKSTPGASEKSNVTQG